MLWDSRVVKIGLRAAALFGGFFITLWLTALDNPSTRPTVGADRYDAGKLVSNDFNLLKAAREVVALPLSQRMTGNIDIINRTSELEVSIVGWVADTEGDGTPTEILVFAGGALVVATQTKGERSDVTQALHSGFGSEKNVSFSVKFNCRPGDQFIVVAIAASKQYFPLGVNQCP